MNVNDFTRVLFLAIILFVCLFLKSWRNDRTDNFILAFTVISVLGELAPLFVPGYNLIHLSVLAVCHLGLVAILINYETSNLKMPLTLLVGGILFFVFLYISDWSSYSLISEGISPSGEYPIGVHQFFDLLSVVNLSLIVLMFVWLVHLVRLVDYQVYDLKKKYLFILAFLIYAGGSFFMVAFSRFIIPSLEEWFSLWNLIYIPIWFVFNTLLFAGLIWRPTRS